MIKRTTQNTAYRLAAEVMRVQLFEIPQCICSGMLPLHTKYTIYNDIIMIIMMSLYQYHDVIHITSTIDRADFISL